MPESVSEQGYKNLIVVAWVTAFVIPIIGFILGIVIVTRPSEQLRKNGTAVIVASIGATFVWLSFVR